MSKPTTTRSFVEGLVQSLRDQGWAVTDQPTPGRRRWACVPPFDGVTLYFDLTEP